MLKNFNLDASAFAAIADTPEAFENTGRTTTLTVGRRISFKGSINGIEVPAYATLKSAKLSRLSVLEQQSNSTGETYKIVTGILKPVVMDLEVVIDGQTMPIHEVLRAFVNENAKKPVSEQEFLATCSRLGLKFVDGMPLFFQQFGASESGIRHAVETFMANGAVDVYPSMKNPGRIKEAYAHETGVEITSFEVGTTDRLQSKTGQGFLNLVDASVDQFSRIVSLRKDAQVLSKKIEAATDWSQDKINAAKSAVKDLLAQSRQWSSNWAGAQQVIKIDADTGSLKSEPQYAAVNLPCGRFTMNGVAVDLWKNSATAENANMVSTIASSDDEDGDDLPW